MKILLSLLAACCLATSSVHAQPSPHRRALLIGINDYTASKIVTHPRTAPAPDRDWPNLAGAVNDVNILREMLVLLYGFNRDDIVTLTDQAATREAILRALQQHLVNTAGKDDVAFFYYAGHGSQVRNSLSDEPDKLDESLVPADSRAGAADIRDKELRKLFNRILDRGAHLTVMLDNCHSGSGARGLSTGALARGVRADLRDVADRVSSPRPEHHGALILSASEDFDTAWETRDAAGTFHGEFSWAWIRAMRDAGGEPASDTFLRARARMRAETPFQQPVMAGNTGARLRPFLGSRAGRRGDPVVVVVEKTRSDGTVIIQGGWANGLAVGTELRDPATSAHLTITALRGVAGSEARAVSPGVTLHSGAVLEIVAWAAPPVPPLRIWTPRSLDNRTAIAAVARSMAGEAETHGIRWITNPIDDTPTHLIRWGDNQWELVNDGGRVAPIGKDAAAIAAVARLAAGSTLFVQLPAPAAWIDAAGIEGVERAARPEDADYLFVGRYMGQHLSFAWLRPSVKKSDRRKSVLPLQTAWVSERSPNGIPALREALLRLRTIRAWQLLESPPSERFPYRLAIRRSRHGELTTDGTSISGGEQYDIVLQANPSTIPARVPPRYLYVFVIDSHGNSTLLFPRSGSVENRFPSSPPPTEIPLGQESAFEATSPYGIDSYFLLSTEEPLPDPWILEHPGVRAPHELTPLERLLALTSSGTRTVAIATPSKWSITKTTYESVAPHPTKTIR